MSTAHWLQSSTLEESLTNKDKGLSFYQTVRLLITLSQNVQTKIPTSVSSDNLADIVTFDSNLDLKFPNGDLEEVSLPFVDETGELNPTRIKVNFYSLFGAHGALPSHYSEHFSDLAAHKRGDSLREFYDIFTNRLLQHFYKTWERARPEVKAETQSKEGITFFLKSLMGLSTEGMEHAPGENRADQISIDHLAYYSGLISHGPKSVARVEQIVSSILNKKVSVQEFSGKWENIPETVRPQFQHSKQHENSARLSHSFLGERAWSHQGSLIVEISDFNAEELQDFIPGKVNFSILITLIRFLLSSEIEFCVKLILKNPPSLKLSAHHLDKNTSEHCNILGVTTWLSGEGQDKKYIIFNEKGISGGFNK